MYYTMFKNTVEVTVKNLKGETTHKEVATSYITSNAAKAALNNCNLLFNRKEIAQIAGKMDSQKKYSVTKYGVQITLVVR